MKKSFEAARYGVVLMLALNLSSGLYLSSGSMLAQGLTGTISGVLKDPAGGVVPNAKVIAKNDGTGQETATASNAEGYYRILNLSAGAYTVSVEANGFRRMTVPAQTLNISANLRVDFALEVGQVTETIEVQGTVAQINSEDAQLGRSLTSIPSLPLLSGTNGRNVLNLVGLQPGVNFGGSVGPFSVNGQRAQANNYLLDGGDSNDLAINVPDSVNVISTNALAEFRVVTGAMKAEYGRNGGAVVEVITKSGSNEFHGSANEIFRNTKLNAVPFFQKVTPGGTPQAFSNGLPRKPQFNVNDYDANFGGPIFKNKTFFFVSFLGFRRRQGVTNSATVFTDAERAAILANGVPAAKAIVNLVPAASVGNTLFSAPSNKLDRDQGLVKGDHRFGGKNSLAFTFFTDADRFVDPFAFSGSSIPGFGSISETRYTNFVLRDTHSFSATLLNDARASFHRRASPGVIPLNSQTPASLGFTGIIPDDASAPGPPNVRISGLTQIGNTIQGPQSRFDNTWQYADTVSWIRGNHAFKFGVDFKAFEQNQLFTFINNGILTIDGGGTQTGLVTKKIPGLSDPLNDFANGFVTDYEQASSARQGYRDKFTSLFAQDDWKVRHNLTVNFGLRWEYLSPLTELHDRLGTFRKGQQSKIFPDAPIGLVYPGDTGVPQSTYSADYNNFAPRLGLAWDPMSNGKLSIRAGYGVFFDAPVSELTLQFLSQPPYGIQPDILSSKDFTHPYSSSVENPIPQPFPYKPIAPGGRFDFTAIAPIGLTIMDPNFRTPYSMQWSTQIQYQVAQDWLADIGYVGTTGVKLLNRREMNFSVVTPAATTGNINGRRILNLGNPQDAAYGGAVFGGITDQLTDANSNYHSLQAALTKRTSHGLTMTHAYTWAHSIDSGSGLRTTGNGNVYSARRDRGNSVQDVRHRYAGSFVYEVPWMKAQSGFLGRILGGWGASGVITLQTGLPFDITEGTDRCLCGGGGNRPDYIGGTVQFLDPRTNIPGFANAFFDGTGGGTGGALTNPYFRRVGTAGTAAAGAGRYGNFGRNVFHAPGLLNADIAISKRTKVFEKQALEFRAESFNFFNHTQFATPTGGGLPVGAISSASFGRITSAGDPRLIQLSLKYLF